MPPAPKQLKCTMHAYLGYGRYATSSFPHQQVQRACCSIALSVALTPSQGYSQRSHDVYYLWYLDCFLAWCVWKVER